MAIFLWSITIFVADFYVFYPTYHEELMLIFTVFIMGLVADLLMSDIRGEQRR